MPLEAGAASKPLKVRLSVRRQRCSDLTCNCVHLHIEPESAPDNPCFFSGKTDSHWPSARAGMLNKASVVLLLVKQCGV